MDYYQALYRAVLFSLCLICSTICSSQCKPPTLLSVTDINPTSVTLSWQHFATNVLGWEIELVPLGATPKFEPTFSLIEEKFKVINNLQVASSYTAFIRTVCTQNSYSEWNPIHIKTSIPQPSPCLFTLPIKNNNCNQEIEEFEIVVDQNGILGQDIFLASVDLIIEHTWPSDLHIEIESPSQKKVVLVHHQGRVTDNFGLITDTTCTQSTAFSDLACVQISDNHPPFIGTFLPRSNLYHLYDNTPIRGVWKLNICDRSIQDFGNLKYIQLNFLPNLCQTPKEIAIRSIDATKVVVSWQSYDGCEGTEVELSLSEQPPGTISTTNVDCLSETVTIENLEPDTEYDIYVKGTCLPNLSSPKSCAFTFTTPCAPITSIENFDNYKTCIPGCDFKCQNLLGNWKNDSINDQQDWIIWDQETTTDNTGPDVGVFNNGNFIYVESSPSICGSNNTAILLSSCFSIDSNSQQCDMSFWYHVEGSDFGSLLLLIQLNESSIWDTLFYASESSFSGWSNTIVSLDQYKGMSGKFQFVATTANGDKGDIAIDQIEFRGSSNISFGNKYYYDNDNDGFGNEDKFEFVCSSIPPIGMVGISGDCNDENSSINPNALEIYCNNIDENCEANDDILPRDISIVSSSIKPQNCNTNQLGEIQITNIDGISPFSILWSTGDTTMEIQNLVSGIYSLTITNANDCNSFVSIYVPKIIDFHIEIVTIQHPTCTGKNDGIITIDSLIDGTQILWNTGDIGDTLYNAVPGNGWLIIENNNGCRSDSIRYDLNSLGSIEADVSFKIDSRCHDDSTGVLRVDAITGQSPFLYEWNTGQRTQQVNKLPKGLYTCTITDNIGCKAIVTATIAASEELVIREINQEELKCHQDRSGDILISVTGGTPPYSYSWNSGEKSKDLINIKAGVYKLTVVDANACTAVSEEFLLTEPELLTVEIDSAATAECLLSTDGYLRITTNGGIPPYDYYWAHTSINTPELKQISPGIYNVTVTDANNCKTALSNYQLDYNNNPIDIDIDIHGENICFQDSSIHLIASATGGTPPFDYNWNTGNQSIKTLYRDTLSHLAGGSYILTITDINGCVGYSDTIIISTINPIQYNVTSKINNTCFGNADGTIAVSAYGDFPPFNYKWNTGEESNRIENLSNGLYNLTISDSNQCSVTSNNISINSPSRFSISVETKPSRPTHSEGSIQLDISGASPPYIIMWDPAIENQNDTKAVDLSPGEYSILVSDQNFCDTTFLVVVDVISHISTIPNEINVFPTTSNGSFHVNANHNIESLSIYNIHGSPIHCSITGSQNNRHVMVSVIPPVVGIYFVQIATNKNIELRKIFLY